jgi:hypothetical protein
MTDPLLTRLQTNDPAATPDPDAASRNAQILARVLAAPPPRRGRPRVRLALVAAACGLAVLGLALGVGRERSGDSDFDAAAATYRALTRPAGLYHFVSVSRMTSEPAGVAQSYSTPALFPPLRFDQAGTPQYHEVWLTPGGAAVRWLAYRRAGGALLHAFAFRQDLKKLVGPRPCQRTGCAAVVGPPSDPATAFRLAYQGGRLRSRGGVTFDGRSLWRFVTRRTGAGSYQEWLIDPSTRLPVRYRNVDHNQQRGVPFTNRLTIRLIKFEVLPLNADTRKLLRLTPAQRALCLAAEHQEIARTRAYLHAHGRRVPPDLRRRALRSCL